MSESHLPVDMRKSSGIGGGARENRDSAIAYESAISATSRLPEQEPPKEVRADVETKNTIEECPVCHAKVSEENNFCAKCGRNLLTSARDRLHLKFADEDLDQYIFRGHVSRTLKVLGRDLVVRSSLSDDHRVISEYLINEWQDKSVTQDFWDNLRGTAAISMAIESFDGKSIGTSVEERVKWMLARGASFSDMVTNQVVLYNRAVTEWLEEKNTFLA